jgi:hypothetical protein
MTKLLVARVPFRGTSRGKGGTVANKIRTGTALVKNDALLPAELNFESEPCVEGWAIVKDLDGREWDHEIQRNGWTSFCFGREIRASVFGIDGQKMARRVIRQLLAGAERRDTTQGFRTKSRSLEERKYSRLAVGTD